jgi:hypothetical protein
MDRNKNHQPLFPTNNPPSWKFYTVTEKRDTVTRSLRWSIGQSIYTCIVNPNIYSCCERNMRIGSFPKFDGKGREDGGLSELFRSLNVLMRSPIKLGWLIKLNSSDMQWWGDDFKSSYLSGVGSIPGRCFGSLARRK